MEPLYSLKGFYNKRVDVYEDRVELVSGSKVKPIKMSDIASVSYAPAVTPWAGHLFIRTADRWAGPELKYTKPGALFSKPDNDKALEMKNYIEKRMAEEKGIASGQGGSYVEELKQLKALLDDGTITQEDYDAKKRQLLGL